MMHVCAGFDTAMQYSFFEEFKGGNSMDGRRPSSYAKTKRRARQRQRYQREKLILCIAILFFVVLAIRCLTRLFVIENKVFGVEQEVRAADASAGQNVESGGETAGQNVAAGSGTGSADEITGIGASSVKQLTGNVEQTGSNAVSQLSESEKQEWENIYRENEEWLILVNKEHSMTKEQELSMRTICKGRLSVAACLYDDLCDMLADAKKENYEYWIASAYRSKEKQQKLVEEDVRKYLAQGCTYEKALEKTYDYVMPAGYSEHQTGLSLDILCAGNLNMDDSQEKEPGNMWMKEHCHEYGFILRYPKEKEDVTGIRYEPWHFRYVGKKAAAWLTERNLTLEDVLPLKDTNNTGQDTAL